MEYISLCWNDIPRIVVSIKIPWIERLADNKEAAEQGFLFIKLKSSVRKFYDRHHDLDDRYGISESQMITNMLHLSYAIPGPFLIYDLSPDL
jgi:hypothetical protein